MRRISSAIVILLVFFSFQYGKVMTYLYCKWQAEKVQQLKDCGCEQHLTGLFADGPSESAPATLKEFAFEYSEKHEVLNLQIPVEPVVCKTGELNNAYQFLFTPGLLRPPIS